MGRIHPPCHLWSVLLATIPLMQGRRGAHCGAGPPVRAEPDEQYTRKYAANVTAEVLHQAGVPWRPQASDLRTYGSSSSSILRTPTVSRALPSGQVDRRSRHYAKSRSHQGERAWRWQQVWAPDRDGQVEAEFRSGAFSITLWSWNCQSAHAGRLRQISERFHRKRCSTFAALQGTCQSYDRLQEPTTFSTTAGHDIREVRGPHLRNSKQYAALAFLAPKGWST